MPGSFRNREQNEMDSACDGTPDRGWELLITAELLDSFLRSPEPVSFTGVTKLGEQVAAALNIAQSTDTADVIGWGWHSQLRQSVPGLIEVTVPPVGLPSAR